MTSSMSSSVTTTTTKEISKVEVVEVEEEEEDGRSFHYLAQFPHQFESIYPIYLFID